MKGNIDGLEWRWLTSITNEIESFGGNISLSPMTNGNLQLQSTITSQTSQTDWSLYILLLKLSIFCSRYANNQLKSKSTQVLNVIKKYQVRSYSKVSKLNTVTMLHDRWSIKKVLVCSPPQIITVELLRQPHRPLETGGRRVKLIQLDKVTDASTACVQTGTPKVKHPCTEHRSLPVLAISATKI